MVNGMNRQEDSKSLEVAQNEINMEREKEALDSIKSQANELDKHLEGKSEPRFSFMKFLRRDKDREPQQSADIEAPSTSGAGSGLDDNGLPSYSEATMDSLTLEQSLPPSKMVADGATQTVEEEEKSEEKIEPEEVVTDNENKTENTNPRRFRFFNFTK